MRLREGEGACQALWGLSGWGGISAVDIGYTDNFSNECFPIPSSPDTEDVYKEQVNYFGMWF